MSEGFHEYHLFVPSARWREDLYDDWKEVLCALNVDEEQLVRGIFQDAVFKLLLEWRRHKHAFADVHRDLLFDDFPSMGIADV